jgi:hypothetical protein
MENSLTFFSTLSHDDRSAMGVRNPVSTTSRRLHELELGRGGVERRPDAQRDREGHERDAQRQPPEEPVAAAIGLADEEQQDGAGKREAPRKSQ